MSERGVAQFISVVGLHFPRPKFDGDEVMEAAWMASMTRSLSGFADDLLTEAAQWIVDNRVPDPKKGVTRFFPLPAECGKICREIAERREEAAPRLRLEGPKSDDWSDERLALAFDLCKSPLGNQAAREGWLPALYEFCRRNMRVPSGNEIAGCIDHEKRLRRTVETIVGRSQEQPSMLNTAIASLAKTFMTERAKRAGASS